MSELRIITNNVPRDLVCGYELSEDERSEFPYIFGDDNERSDAISPEDAATREFFRYKGLVYDLGEFMRVPESFARNGMGSADASEMCRWDGYQSDSFFSGIVIRWPVDEYSGPDFERVIVGTYVA